MSTGTSLTQIHRDQCKTRSALLVAFAAIALFTLTYSNQANASDRDTPAYMIYVDPITGKYSTKPPEDNTGATGAPAANTQGLNNSGTELTTVQSTNTDTKAPIIAILLLTAAGLVSLLLKGKQTY